MEIKVNGKWYGIDWFDDFEEIEMIGEIEETKMYPERQGFVSYISKEVNELFGFFMAGVRYGRMSTERENQNV